MIPNCAAGAEVAKPPVRVFGLACLLLLSGLPRLGVKTHGNGVNLDAVLAGENPWLKGGEGGDELGGHMDLRHWQRNMVASLNLGPLRVPSRITSRQGPCPCCAQGPCPWTSR